MFWMLSEPLSVERLTVAIADLPVALSGVKLVQLSDLHFDGWRLSEKMLAQAIAVCNEEEPDLVLLTGDFVTDDPSPIERCVLHLKYLESRCGVFACLGNHDLEFPDSKPRIQAALERVGIQVLWNAIAYPLGPELPLVGLADYWSGEFNPGVVLEQLAPQTPRLVLSHNPDTAAILKKWRVDLQLSGHTHGGQINVPGFGPGPVLVQALRDRLPKALRPWVPFQRECAKVVRYWQWAQGWHQIGKNQLYVNRGLGTYFPGRWFCPPEVSILSLERAN